MSRLGNFIARIFGTTPKTPTVPQRRGLNFGAKYDAAQTTPENRKHWANADGLSPITANTPAVRKALRERARYERDNDPHLNGLVKTLAYDFIGSGPRLQLQFAAKDYEKALAIESSWKLWCRAVGLADKLRIMHESRVVDGEVFALLTSNLKNPHPVKLDLRVVETDRVTAGMEWTGEYNEDDGITFDNDGNPTTYRVLNHHPGDYTGAPNTYTGRAFLNEGQVLRAYQVLHWFRPTRPGQTRGVSELTACLSVCAQTRRYAQAVLTAAEFAAMLAGVMHTSGPAYTDTPPTVDSLDEVEMVRGALLTLPEGWDAKQFKSEQPTSTYKEFIAEKHNEKGRPVLAPQNVVTGNSSGYNYSSGRLDHIPYHRSIWIERERFRSPVIDRIFIAWLIEASARGIIDDDLQPFTEWSWDWQWDGFDSLDPMKDAQATQLRLQIGLTTLSEVCAADGKNWRDVVDQQALEREYILSKGLTPYNADPAPAMPPSTGPDAPADDEELEDTEEPEDETSDDAEAAHA